MIKPTPRVASDNRPTPNQLRTPKPPSFNVSPADATIIRAIVVRAVALTPEKIDKLSLSMDITACHANGNPLKLQELLDADDANFGHDVFGIHRFIDRTTGKMTDLFCPRFTLARGVVAEVQTTPIQQFGTRTKKK